MTTMHETPVERTDEVVTPDLDQRPPAGPSSFVAETA